MTNPPLRTGRHALPWPRDDSTPDGAEMLNDIGRVAAIGGTRVDAAMNVVDRGLSELESGLPADPWTAFEPPWRIQGSLIELDYDEDGGGVLDCAYVRYAYDTMIMRFQYALASSVQTALTDETGALVWSLPAAARRPRWRNGLTQWTQYQVIGHCGMGGYISSSQLTVCHVRFASSMNRINLWRTTSSGGRVVTGNDLEAATLVFFDVVYETASRGAG